MRIKRFEDIEARQLTRQVTPKFNGRKIALNGEP
jgi:hypothetical protein